MRAGHGGASVIVTCCVRLLVVVAYDREQVTSRSPSWAGNAIWAVLDYALFALAGMLATVLLARGLPEQTFGAYAVSFAVYVGLLLVHVALFAEPMLVLLSNRFRDRSGPYLRALLTAHVVFSAAVVAVVSAAAFVFLPGEQDSALRHAMIGMALSAPFSCLAQLLRRVCYALWSTRSAAFGAGLYLALQTVLLLALDWFGVLGIETAYAVFALTGLAVSSAWLVRTFRRMAAQPERLPLGVVVREHVAFARYGVGTALLGWIPQNLWYVILPWLLAGDDKLGATGRLRALVTLIQPMMQVNGALGTLLVPTFARRPELSPWRTTWIATAISALYAPFLVLLGPGANELLYRGAYPSDAATFWVLGAVPAGYAFSTSLRVYAVAHHDPALPLRATFAGALFCLTLGVGLCTWRPLLGAGLAMLTSYALQCAVLAWLIAQRRRADRRFSSPSRAA